MTQIFGPTATSNVTGTPTNKPTGTTPTNKPTNKPLDTSNVSNGKNVFGGVSVGGNVSSLNQDLSVGLDPKDSKKRQRDNYTNEQQDQDLSTWNKRLNDYTSKFIDNPQDWYRLYNYWNWNLGKNNPDGNLNNKAFSDTLLQSRLADALNNERHIKLGKLGYRTNSSFGSEASQLPGTERWEPIETQEMRQMRANEEMDKAARQRQVGRAQNIQDYPFTLQQAQDQANLTNMADLAKNVRDIERMIQETDISTVQGQSWQTYWQSKLNAYQKNLEIYGKNYATSVLMNMDPSRVMYIASVWNGGNCNYEDLSAALSMDGTLKSMGLSPTDPLGKYVLGTIGAGAAEYSFNLKRGGK